MAFSVVILAAGKGTRMKSSLPKVLHPIADKPIVQHIIDTATQIGAENVHLVYGHGADQLQAALADNTLNWCLQAEQLGTGHAVQQTVDAIGDDEDVMILVGDAPLITPDTLKELIAVKQQADLALLTVHLDDPTGMGRIVRKGDNITAIVEHKDCAPEQLAISEINTGMMVINGKDLKRWLSQLSNDNAQAEYYLTDVIAMAANEGKTIRAAHPAHAVEVEGINNRSQLARLERAYQQREAHRLMMAGVTLLDPNRFDLRGELSCGQDSVIDINVIVKGKVTIGSNVTIGAHCILDNCNIADNAVIEAHSIVQQADVGEGAQVGPYARLRPGAVMKANSKVGNFVEMKKTVLGEGSKANHFTYLGDTKVGSDVNIGAGTITCNYDGVNKHLTEIGDNAFIGSNSSLVAPVSIGKGATVGAGSTVTKAVSEDALAVARGKQVELTQWQRPTKKS